MSSGKANIVNEQVIKEMMKQLHLSVIESLHKKNNDRNGRENARMILNLQATSRKFADPIAVYDARRYMLRDLMAPLNRIWMDALALADPVGSKLWAHRGNIPGFRHVYFILDERLGSHLGLKLRDVGIVYELAVNGTGIARDVMYDEFANAVLEVEELYSRAEALVHVIQEQNQMQKKILDATLFNTLREKLNRLMDDHEDDKLGKNGIMMAKVQEITELCKQGIKVTSPDGFEEITKKVFGKRPSDRPRANLARANSAPPTDVKSEPSSGRKAPKIADTRRKSAGGQGKK